MKLTSVEGFILPKTDEKYTNIEITELENGLVKLIATSSGLKPFKLLIRKDNLQSIIGQAQKEIVEEEADVQNNIPSKPSSIKKAEGTGQENKGEEIQLINGQASGTLTGDSSGQALPPGKPVLTAFQVKVKALLDKDMSVEEIAKELERPESTIRQSIAQIKEKLGSTEQPDKAEARKAELEKLSIEELQNILGEGNFLADAKEDELINSILEKEELAGE